METFFPIFLHGYEIKSGHARPGYDPCLVPSLQVHDLKVELRNIKGGLHKSSRFVQEPKQLKEAIKELYRKHLQDFDQVGRGGWLQGDFVFGPCPPSHMFHLSYLWAWVCVFMRVMHRVEGVNFLHG